MCILPRPHTPGGPPIILGGTSNAAARRAARIADGFLPSAPKFFEAYREELAAWAARSRRRWSRTTSARCSSMSPKTPNETGRRIGPHALHEMNDYGAGRRATRTTPTDASRIIDELRATGRYLVLTPDECVAHARATRRLFLKPLMGGLDPDLAWESLELIESKVLPEISEP